ncbi:transcriptional repressor NrdR [Candidatus Shapirobacteria bacterium]|nr:transcriptional repressor NrdR [Candidatus Shapirobacteria bacterium]
MFCPSCGSEQIEVTNSRPTNKGTQIWRRRKCLKCEFVFTTHEKIDLAHITVVKKSGKRVKYVGAKLYSSIYHAVVGEKKLDRGSAGIVAVGIFDKVEERLILSKEKWVTTEKIANLILTTMKKVNMGSWLRYLAFFKVDGKKAGEKTIKKYLSAT